MPQIEMLQHYCGYRNGNVDWLAGELHDVDDETAADLVERKYARLREVAEQLSADKPDTLATKVLDEPTTRAGKASETLGKIMRDKSAKK